MVLSHAVSQGSRGGGGRAAASRDKSCTMGRGEHAHGKGSKEGPDRRTDGLGMMILVLCETCMYVAADGPAPRHRSGAPRSHSLCKQGTDPRSEVVCV